MMIVIINVKNIRAQFYSTQSKLDHFIFVYKNKPLSVVMKIGRQVDLLFKK